MSQPNGFWEQYKENAGEYNRQAPWRLLRLLVAFGLSILLAPCCAAAAAITGEPMAAMVVAVVGIVVVVITWRAMLWVMGRGGTQPLPPAGFPPAGYAPHPPGLVPLSHMSAGQSPFAPTAAGGLPPPSSGYGKPFPIHAGFVQPAYAAQLPGQPILGASTGPVPPFATEPPARSGAGCTIAAVALIGVLFLSCCGGGIAVVATLPHWRMHAGPQQPMAGPAIQPFGFPGPAPGAIPGPPGAMPGAPFPHHDPFEEMRRAQDKSLQDLMDEHQRQMREFDEEFRRQNELPRPGF